MKQFVKIENEEGQSFTMSAQDFIYSIDELLSELQEIRRDTKEYNEHRKNLISTYYTYFFFAREYNWKIDKRLEQLRDTVLFYSYQESTAYNEPCFKNQL